VQSERPAAWSEDESRAFLDQGRFFVPEREEQIETVVRLVPDPGSGHLLDLCCGEGLLSKALLERFPNAAVHGLDGSAAMLARAQETLSAFGDRFEARAFDLADAAWRSFPWPLHGIVSSLAVHHLDDREKRRLYRDLAALLAPGGALVIADLIQPAHTLGTAAAAKAWDEAVRRRSLDLAGNLDAYNAFRDTGWNLYAMTEPDPYDKPSRVLDHLHWLGQAGLVDVDVYWLKAGHAIYGGVKASPSRVAKTPS
jgi:tRNA (cmo5U34)-methyltransferase